MAAARASDSAPVRGGSVWPCLVGTVGESHTVDGDTHTARHTEGLGRVCSIFTVVLSAATRLLVKAEWEPGAKATGDVWGQRP